MKICFEHIQHNSIKENKPPRPRSIERNNDNHSIIANLKAQNSKYLKKIKQIESFIQSYPDNPVIESLKKLLYGNNF